MLKPSWLLSLSIFNLLVYSLFFTYYFQIHTFAAAPPPQPPTPVAVYLSAHLLLFSRVDLDVFAEGAGICVALGAAGDLTGVRLLSGGGGGG